MLESSVKCKMLNVALGKRAGFTLIEVLMSVALITVIAGIGVPIYQSFQVKNDLDLAVNTWSQTIRRAEILSQGMDGDSTWGVKAQGGSIILFKGASYTLRDANYDEVFEIPGSIIFSGLTEIVFAKLTGYPTSTGTTTLTSSTGDTKNVTINSKGLVSY